MTNLNSRQMQLFQMIEKAKTISVTELIARLDASPATIRNDLAYCEAQGLIRRTRGEAHLLEENSFIPFSLRSGSNTVYKQAIARAAVKYIQEDETIILDDGTTTLEIAKLLLDYQHLTVITHSLDVANILSANHKITLILPGGIFTSETRSLLGPSTEAFYATIEADKLFLSISGVRSNIGVAVTPPLEAAIKKNAIHASKKVFAVFDSSKFFKTALNMFAEFRDLDYIITAPQCDLDASMLEALKTNSVELVFAKPVEG